MEFINECEKYFGTKNLYEILEIPKTSTIQEIKSAYRKKSLKVHPDRIQSSAQKESAKNAFQLLTKVHCVLSNEEYRKVYDETGMIITGDNDTIFQSMATFDEFLNYWRQLFPRINMKQLEDFEKNYINSEEEEMDLIKLYNKFEGDLDMIYEYHFFYDENRVTNILNKLIDTGKIPKYDAFVGESKTKKNRRLKRIEKEKVMAEKEDVKSNDTRDLILAIQQRNESKKNSFDDLMKNIEAKYCNGKSTTKVNKNKKRRN